jgi:uncharacterized protein (TIGR04255 family)
LQYSRSPIFEATVEFRSEPKSDEEEFRRIAKRLVAVYPRAEEVRNYEVMLAPSPGVTLGKLDSLRLLSDDAADLVSVRLNGVSYSRLSPYLGWEGFLVHAQRLFRVWQKETGRRKITRLGLRARNRLDINQTDLARGGDGAYVTPRAELPGIDFESRTSTTIVVQGQNADNMTIMVAIMRSPSPLIDHVGLVVDLDFGLELEVPQQWSDITATLERMREIRNLTFDATLTDAAKSLIR